MVILLKTIGRGGTLWDTLGASFTICTYDDAHIIFSWIVHTLQLARFVALLV